MQLPAPLGQSVAVPYPESVGGITLAVVTPIYGPVVTPNLTLGSSFTITATDGVAFQVANPIGALQQGSTNRISITIKNASGGVLGAVTWGTAYKQAGSFAAGNGQRRSAQFEFDGTNWVLIAGPTGDIPN